MLTYVMNSFTLKRHYQHLVNLSVFLSFRFSVCLSFCLSASQLICISACLWACLSVYVSVWLSGLYVCRCKYRYDCVCIYIYVCMSVCLHAIMLPIWLYVPSWVFSRCLPLVLFSYHYLCPWKCHSLRIMIQEWILSILSYQETHTDRHIDRQIIRRIEIGTDTYIPYNTYTLHQNIDSEINMKANRQMEINS